MQLLNVYFGGTLIQDMDNHRGAERTVALREHSYFEDSLGDQVNVSCWHHQAVKKPGEDLIITMYDAEDLTIEGFEHKYLPVYGIQWHPEGSECGRKVIDAFLKKVLQESNRRESDFVLPRNKRKQELIPEKRGRLLLVSKGD
jgi:putative glutamine amidotransferase